jgi:hypothetical protein
VTSTATERALAKLMVRPNQGSSYNTNVTVPHQILENASWWRLVPLWSCTFEQLSEYIRTPPTTTTITRDGIKSQGIVWPSFDRLAEITLEQFRYAVPRWLEIQKGGFGAKFPDSLAAWSDLFALVLTWTDLAEELDGVIVWFNNFMTNWANDPREFEPEATFAVVRAAALKFRLRKLEGVQIAGARFQSTVGASSGAGSSQNPYSGGRVPADRQRNLAPSPYERNPKAPFRDNTGRGSSGRCFICGETRGDRDSHSASTCHASKTARGATPKAVWNAATKSLDCTTHRGKRFCLAFQTHRGCSNNGSGICGSNADVMHQCSVCGRAGHNASSGSC